MSFALLRFRSLSRAASLALAGALVLAGCATPPPPAPVARPAAPPITGQLVLRGEAQLPAGLSTASGGWSEERRLFIEVVDLGRDRVLHSERVAVKDGRFPAAFEFSVPRATVARAPLLGVRGVVSAGEDAPSWIGAPRWFDGPAATVPGDVAIDVGPVAVFAVPVPGTSTRLECPSASGRLEWTAGADGKDRLELTVGPRKWTLEQVPAGTGTRFAAVNDPETRFWLRGTQVLLTVEGTEYLGCRIEELMIRPLRARGVAPDWSATIGGALQFKAGDRSIQAPAPAAQAQAAGLRWDAAGTASPLAVAVRGERCSLPGVRSPFPFTAEARDGDATLRGCAGEPIDLVIPHNWRITPESAAASRISPVTMVFRTDGRIDFLLFCFRVIVEYSAEDDRLRISPRVIGEVPRCPAEVKPGEEALLAALRNVERFELEAGGELVLAGPRGARIALRRFVTRP